jgi:hypothetical protein
LIGADVLGDSCFLFFLKNNTARMSKMATTSKTISAGSVRSERINLQIFSNQVAKGEITLSTRVLLFGDVAPWE